MLLELTFIYLCSKQLDKKTVVRRFLCWCSDGTNLKFVFLAGLPLKEKWEAFGLKLNHAHQQMKMTENALLFAFVEVFRYLHFDARGIRRSI